MRDDRSEQNLWIGFGIIAPVLAAALLVSFRDVMLSVNVALVLVVVVVAAAAAGGRVAGGVAAVSATLSFDFFHTQPYLRLTIDSADEIETTILLLAVGVIVGQVAGRSMRARRSADESSEGVRRIYRVAELVAEGADVADVRATAQSELERLLRLQSARFEEPPFSPPLARLERSGVVSGRREHRYHPDGFEFPSDGVELLVLSQGEISGRFVLEPAAGVGVTLEQRVVAVAIADQVGAAMAARRPQRPMPNPET